MQDSVLTCQFEIEHMPGAKMGLEDYIFWLPNQKTDEISTYDEEIIVAQLDLIFASANSLIIKSSQPALHLLSLQKLYDPAPRITTDSESNIN